MAKWKKTWNKPRNFAPGNDWKLRRKIELAESKRRMGVKARLVKKLEVKKDG